jgi:hypothetical protein
MANIRTPDFANLWSKKIAFLSLVYKNTIHLPLDSSGAMERMHVVLIYIARPAECTPASVKESSQWTEVINAAETSTNLQLLLEARYLHSTLHDIYAEMLNDLKSVLQETRQQPGQSN